MFLHQNKHPLCPFTGTSQGISYEISNAWLLSKHQPCGVVEADAVGMTAASGKICSFSVLLIPTCDFRQCMQALCASPVSSVKWNHTTHLTEKLRRLMRSFLQNNKIYICQCFSPLLLFYFDLPNHLHPLSKASHRQEYPVQDPHTIPREWIIHSLGLAPADSCSTSSWSFPGEVWTGIRVRHEQLHRFTCLRFEVSSLPCSANTVSWLHLMPSGFGSTVCPQVAGSD